MNNTDFAILRKTQKKVNNCVIQNYSNIVKKRFS